MTLFGCDTRLAEVLGLKISDIEEARSSFRSVVRHDAFSVDDLDELMSFRRLEELMGRVPLTSHMVQLDRDGNRLPELRYTSPFGSQGTPVRYVDTQKVFRRFLSGYSITVRDLHRLSPEIADQCWRISEALGVGVTGHGYVTPPGSTALKPHFDYNDILVVQLEGEKKWHTYDVNGTLPLSQPFWRVPCDSADPTILDHRPAPSGSEILRPGSVMFLPRGKSHSVSSLDSTTFHLTFPLHAATPYDVVNLALHHVSESESLRETVRLGAAAIPDADRGGHLGTAMDELLELGRRIGGERLGAEAFKLIRSDMLETPLMVFSQARTLATLHGGTTLQRRKNLCCSIIRDESCIELMLRDERIRLPVSAASIVDQMLSGAPVTVDTFLANERVLAMSIAKTLVSSGVLSEVRP